MEAEPDEGTAHNSTTCCPNLPSPRRSKMSLTFHYTSQSWKLAILLVTLVLYMCFCAFVFNKLESENDKRQYRDYKELKDNCKRRFNMSEEEFLEFVRDASIMTKRGYTSGYKDYWNFYHSFWFTTTVITTMGEWILLIKTVVSDSVQRYEFHVIRCENTN